MMLHYKSDYPNQVHQLNVSISKNYYLLKDGTIKYQAKKFDINWKNYSKTNKIHLVNFLVRDHYSNCFYAELHEIDKMPSVKDFLFNAWRKKEHFEFRGMPRVLILSRKVLADEPDIENATSNLEKFDIELARNGFATGISALKNWESWMNYYTGSYNCKKLIDFQDNIERFCRDYNTRKIDKPASSLEKWVTNEPRGVLINDKEEFDELFVAKS